MENFVFSLDFASATPEEWGARCTKLMDTVEAIGQTGPLMQEITEIANWLDWFYPELLDKRFQ